MPTLRFVAPLVVLVSAWVVVAAWPQSASGLCSLTGSRSLASLVDVICNDGVHAIDFAEPGRKLVHGTLPVNSEGDFDECPGRSVRRNSAQIELRVSAHRQFSHGESLSSGAGQNLAQNARPS